MAMPTKKATKAKPATPKASKPSTAIATKASSKPEVIIALLPDRMPWEYHPWETLDSYNMFTQYLRMGKDRSLSQLLWKNLPETKREEYLAKIRSEGWKESEIGANGLKKKHESVPGGVARLTSFCNNNLTIWSAKYKWQERILKWDEHVAKLEQQQLIDARKDLVRRSVEQGQVLQQLGMKQIERMKANDNLKLGVRDSIALIEAGHKMEKSGLGIDDETANKINNQTNVQLNFGAVSDDELSRMLEIAAKMGA